MTQLNRILCYWECICYVFLINSKFSFIPSVEKNGYIMKVGIQYCEIYVWNEIYSREITHNPNTRLNALRKFNVPYTSIAYNGPKIYNPCPNPSKTPIVTSYSVKIWWFFFLDNSRNLKVHQKNTGNWVYDNITVGALTKDIIRFTGLSGIFCG